MKDIQTRADALLVHRVAEVAIIAPTTPTFIKVLGETMKDMPIRADAHLIHWAAKVAIVAPTRR